MIFKTPKKFWTQTRCFQLFFLRIFVVIYRKSWKCFFFLNKRRFIYIFGDLGHWLMHIWCQRLQECKYVVIKVNALPTLFLIYAPLWVKLIVKCTFWAYIFGIYSGVYSFSFDIFCSIGASWGYGIVLQLGFLNKRPTLTIIRIST